MSIDAAFGDGISDFDWEEAQEKIAELEAENERLRKIVNAGHEYVHAVEDNRADAGQRMLELIRLLRPNARRFKLCGQGTHLFERNGGHEK